MITLDTDLYSIYKLFNISAKRLSEYGNKSLEEIMEAEAASGNTAAASFSTEVLNNPTELAKLFKLSSPENKFAILSNLSDHDLKELVPLLDKSDLVYGLNFFTKDKLLKLMDDLPKEQLLKVVFEMFSPEQVMQMMPDKEMDKFLQSYELDKNMVLKNLKALPPEMLAQIIEAATGKPVQSMEQMDLLKELSTLPPEKYKDAMTAIPRQRKRELILQLTKEKPELFQLFSNEAYVKMISNKEKPDIVKSCKALDPEQLVKMISQLPQDLLAVVMTQMDTEKFAAMLIKNYKDILSQIVAA